MSVGVNLLSLAYMVEISVVFNLAYRELKFTELHDEVNSEVNKLLSVVNLKHEALGGKEKFKGFFPEIDIIGELADTTTKGNGKGDSILWEEKAKLRIFYNMYIKSKASLKLVNLFIFLNIIMLIAFTLNADWQVPTPFAIYEERFIIWLACFLLLLIITIAPLYFINRASHCKKILLGYDRSGNLYVVIDDVLRRLDILLENRDVKPNKDI